MNKRLLQFLNAENISQSQLADKLGVARAGVSHVISGRNKPGYDFMLNLMSQYPDLNIEWLMTGKGKMYKSQQRLYSEPEKPVSLFPDISPANSEEISLFQPRENNSDERNNDTREQEDHTKDLKTDLDNTQTSEENENPVQSDSKTSDNVTFSDINTLVNKLQKPIKQRVVTKVVIFFDDNTFQEII